MIQLSLKGLRLRVWRSAVIAQTESNHRVRQPRACMLLHCCAALMRRADACATLLLLLPPVCCGACARRPHASFVWHVGAWQHTCVCAAVAARHGDGTGPPAPTSRRLAREHTRAIHTLDSPPGEARRQSTCSHTRAPLLLLRCPTATTKH